MPSTKIQPKDCQSAGTKNIICQTMRENFGQNYAHAFFVKNVMEKVGLSVRMARGWLFLPIVVSVFL